MNELGDQNIATEFLVHLGNFVETNNCQTDSYANFRSLLRTSKIDVPVFMLPGAQDLEEECLDPTLAGSVGPLQYWGDFFRDLDSFWPNSFTHVERGSRSSENLSAAFSIYHNEVLFIGLDLLWKEGWSQNDYADHLDQNLNWVRNQLLHPIVLERQLRSLVFYGNTGISEANRPFFQNLVVEIEAADDVPALYLHEGEAVKADFPVGNDLLFITVESGYMPFMIVIVNTDGGEFAFQFVLQ